MQYHRMIAVPLLWELPASSAHSREDTFSRRKVPSLWANDANNGKGGCEISHPVVPDPMKIEAGCPAHPERCHRPVHLRGMLRWRRRQLYRKRSSQLRDRQRHRGKQSRHLQATLAYLVSGSRSLSISVDDGPDQQVNLTGTSWHYRDVTTSGQLNAGANSNKFHNDTAYAPDLDSPTVGCRLIMMRLPHGRTRACRPASLGDRPPDDGPVWKLPPPLLSQVIDNEGGGLGVGASSGACGAIRALAGLPAGLGGEGHHRPPPSRLTMAIAVAGPPPGRSWRRVCGFMECSHVVSLSPPQGHRTNPGLTRSERSISVAERSTVREGIGEGWGARLHIPLSRGVPAWLLPPDGRSRVSAGTWGVGVRLRRLVSAGVS